MRTGIILSFILLLSSCFRKSIPVSFCHTGEFILKDTSHNANEYLQSFEDDGFPIYYLGPSKDTISSERVIGGAGNAGSRSTRHIAFSDIQDLTYPYKLILHSLYAKRRNILIKKDLLTVIVTQTVTIMLQRSLYVISAIRRCHWGLLFV